MNKTRQTFRLTVATLALGLAGLAGGAWAQPSAGTASRAVYFIVAVVNSEPITNGDVARLRQRLERETQNDSPRPSRDELTRIALEQLINQKAQAHEARDSGIRIDEELVDQTEQSIAESNQISRDEFRRRLQILGTSPSAFREELREQILVQRLRDREMQSRLRVSDLEIEQFLREQSGPQTPAEINLGMVLIAVPENTSPAQLEQVQQRAAVGAERARRGEDFAQLVRTFSQAFDRATNDGVLGLRPTDRYPDLFVEAVRSLRVGEVSDPVRSGAGFHVLKLLERRSAGLATSITQTRVRHILLRPGPQLTQEAAREKLAEVRRQITARQKTFEAVAREISQDGSAPQGGDLGWASPGMFVPEFERVMEQLPPGQISEPLVSRFGVHLLEVTERREQPLSTAERRELARQALREKKQEQVFVEWAQEVRGRAYVEMREPPQ
ncbi:peptidylprolyl isomerase [Limnohabitans sp.]|uniref:peptidylprolyl isomerase n=1 Tax=Limnohabitans sp. TaxID=1907725 RepID=UPI00391D82AE